MTARRIYEALGGKEAGGGYVVKCVCHDDEEPSLSIKDASNGDIVVHCHAGCDWKDVKDELTRMGLLEKRIKTVNKTKKRMADDSGGFIFREAKKNVGAISKYMAHRKIKYPSETLPESPAIRVGQYKDEHFIVFAMTKPDDRSVMAVQRIPFDPETKKKTGKGRMYGGSGGYCLGRGVWFYRKSDMTNLIVGEGCETVMSAMQATGFNGVAALTSSGLKNIAMPDPSKIKNVYIAVDSDKKKNSSRSNSGRGGQKAALELAKRLENDGFENVLLVTPCDSTFTDDPEKMDFNDLMMVDDSGTLIRERFELAVKRDKIDFNCDAQTNNNDNSERNSDEITQKTTREMARLNKDHAAVIVGSRKGLIREIIALVILTATVVVSINYIFLLC